MRINRDPIAESGGVNVYGFVGNDGINYVDKLGMFRWLWEGCCNGKKYNRLTETCCEKGKVVRDSSGPGTDLIKSDDKYRSTNITKYLLVPGQHNTKYSHSYIMVDNIS